MKTEKKLAKLQLEKFSQVFLQLGILLALFIVYLVIEHKTPKKRAGKEEVTTTTGEVMEVNVIPPAYVRERVKVITPQTSQTTLIDNPVIIDNTDDKTVEAIINEPNTDEGDFNINDVTTVKIEETISPDEDPTLGVNFVQKAPLFKGCEDLSETENRQCLTKKLNRLIQRNFNTDLANQLGLRKGKNKIITQFIIDKNGIVTDIKIRAPHPRLEKEANKIIKKIPQFKPGLQQGKPVKVRYTQPITFMVE